MTPRLASRIQVSALIRLVEGRGGTGAVLSKGDGEAGAILLILAERGTPRCILERVLDPAGQYCWQATGPSSPEGDEAFSSYIDRRRRNDDDLWVVELDVAGVPRFAAELTSMG